MHTLPLRPHRFVLIGKAVLILAGSTIAGRAYHAEIVGNNLKYSTITAEEYAAGFEDYKAELQQPDWPTWAHVALYAFMFLGFFTLYELIGQGLGLLLQRVVPKGDAPPTPSP